MRATLRLPHRATRADYLAVEANAEARHEFIDGVIVAMPGRSDEHNAIEETQRGRYSDGSIICGKPEHPRHDGQATTNPKAVFEVLSPSSEGDDEGDKRRDFQSLESLEAYVVAAQDERCVRVYRRTAGRWQSEPDTYRTGQSSGLPTLASALSVDEIYEGVLDDAGRSLLR